MKWGCCKGSDRKTGFQISGCTAAGMNLNVFGKDAKQQSCSNLNLSDHKGCVSADGENWIRSNFDGGWIHFVIKKT